jgi:uncharacterized protein
MLLSDDLLLDYKRCQRRAFLNLYGNPQERDGVRDFLLKLRRQKQLHRQTVLAEVFPDFQQPVTPLPQWEAIAQETEALMQRGVNCIYQGVLLQSQMGEFPSPSSESSGCHCEGGVKGVNLSIPSQNTPRSNLPLTGKDITLMGIPDLLLKYPGQSKYGDWVYYPITIELGRRPKPQYKLVAAFYAYLLAKIQGVLPPTAQIVLRRQNIYTLDLGKWLPLMLQTLSECSHMLLQPSEPEVFISRQRCSLCDWYTHCYAIAQSEKHLSLVPGVTPSRYEDLQTMGVSSIGSLAAACPINLGEVMGFEIAAQLKQQAQAIVENRVLWRVEQPPTIPSAPIELYFDIEAEPERNLDYLLGIFLVDRFNQTQQFYAFLAETPEDEGKVWNQFFNFVYSFNDAPIFHFSGYEVETMRRLGNLYKTPYKQLEGLLNRCVDLHEQVTAHYTLPVESYSLKSLANWLGFYWRDEGIRGDQCVCWYDQWLKTGDRGLLESILRYNEDDCRATFHLKNWLYCEAWRSI